MTRPSPDDVAVTMLLAELDAQAADLAALREQLRAVEAQRWDAQQRLEAIEAGAPTVQRHVERWQDRALRAEEKLRAVEAERDEAEKSFGTAADVIQDYALGWFKMRSERDAALEQARLAEEGAAVFRADLDALVDSLRSCGSVQILANIRARMAGTR